MTELSKHPWLALRGQVFWFRAKVPIDLKSHFSPKLEITFSLRTSDRKEALERVRVEAVKLDQDFAAARRLRDAIPQSELSDVEVERLATLYLHQLLEEDEEVRRDGLGGEAVYAAVREQLAGRDLVNFAPEDPVVGGLTEREYLKKGEAIEIVGGAHKAALARGRVEVIYGEVDELLEANGLSLDKASDAYRKVSYAVLRASVKAANMITQRHKGEAVETPQAPMPFRRNDAKPDANAIRFTDLFDKWKAAHHGPDKTKDEFGVQVRRFVEVNGDLWVGEITPAHVRDFKDAMLDMPAHRTPAQRLMTVPQILASTKDKEILRLSPRTVREKSVASIRAILGYAKDNDYRSDNPASGIKIKDTGGQGRAPVYPFVVAELVTFFSSPVFANGARPSGGGGEAAKWMPLLALFTGARLEELAQLNVGHVRVEEGVSYISIGADKRVKNTLSRRKTPLHPELERLGFSEYVESMRKTQQERLFPEIQSARGQVSAAWSKWFGRYRESCGITETGKVFHSFRHTVKRFLREAGVEKTLRDALMGHAHSDVAEEYGLSEDGLGVSLPTLYKALAMLQYRGLDLSHLYPKSDGHCAAAAQE
tara:strand:+ start:136 stop:1923 length:1788 start_codon:yes stop_codon:yes gene_type:complete